MYKAGFILTGLLGLVISFQNCSAQNDFSQGAAAQVAGASSSSSSSGTATQCYSYVLNGSPSNNGSYIANVVAAGTQIYQKLACNGRPMNIGYQASYCNGGMASCDNCAGGAATYVCGANGYWSKVAVNNDIPTPMPTPSPTTQGCFIKYPRGGSIATANASAAECANTCQERKNSNPSDTLLCSYNGVAF